MRNLLFVLFVLFVLTVVVALNMSTMLIAQTSQLPDLPPPPLLLPQSQQTETSTLHVPASTTDNSSVPFDQIYKEYVDSVVGILLPTSVATGNPNPDFDGTGFVYSREGNIIQIVTPAHVIAGYETEPIDVFFPDGITYTTKVLGSDTRMDIALLQLLINSTERTYEPISLGNSSEVAVGEEVLAIGNPFLAGGQTLPNLASSGIVGAAGIEAVIPPGIIGAIVTDVPIAGGSSGSPLFNHKGEVMAMMTQGDVGEQCCSYGVPSNLLRKIASSLAATGVYDYPWIGIQPVTLTTADILAFGLPDDLEGIKVYGIDRDGPAHKAGISASIINEFGEEELGDVVTAINGHPIITSDQFDLLIEESLSVGDRVSLSVFRNGTMIDIPVTIE